MRKLVLTIFLGTVMVMLTSAQDYKTGVGLRVGPASGFTIKHFVSAKGAFEGLLTTKWHGFDMTGLYEVHNRAFDTDYLKWFYGGGAHIGFYNGEYVEWGTPRSSYGVMGIDGIIGIEYTFEEAPVNLGLDMKPTLNFIGNTGLWAEFGLTARFIF